jgi:hypothetical protein
MRFAIHDTRRPGTRFLDFLAAACIAGAGYLHYCLYIKGYRAIPTIGTGFLLQFVGSAVVAGALIIPFEFHARAGRVAVSARVASRMAGVILGLGTLAAFVLSRLPGGLFDFQERGLQPAPQSLLTILTEGAAVVLLVAASVLEVVHPSVGPVGVPVQAAPRHRASV